MQNMKRISVSLSPEMEQRIVDLRKTDKFCRSSLSEIIRTVLEEGMKGIAEEQTA